MSEIRPHTPRGSVPPQLEDDLRALRDTTSTAIPELERSVTAVRSRRRAAAQRWGEYLMPITNAFTRRPWLTTAGVAVAAAIALTLVPVSYQRTTGTDVTLSVAGVHDLSRGGDIANEMKAVLGAKQVSMKAEMAETGAALTLQAFVPAASGVNPAARANALARELTARGYDAAAVSTPHHEQVSGNVYALAKDLVIRVDTDGKSAAQIEGEIRQRLAENGVTNSEVSVTDSGNQRKVTVKAEQVGDAGAEGHGDISLQMMKNGQPLTPENGTSVRVEKTRGSDGVTTKLDVTSRGKTVTVSIPNSETLSDAALGSAITSQLRAAGLDLDVTVTGGQVTIGDPR